MKRGKHTERVPWKYSSWMLDFVNGTAIGEMQAKTDCFTQLCQYCILSLSNSLPQKN